MSNGKKFFKLYKSVLELSKYFDKKEIISLVFFLLLVILASLAEAGSVLSAGLFAASFTGIENIESSAGILGKMVTTLNFTLNSTFSVGILFAFFALLAGVFRVAALWINTSTSARIGSSLSSKAYKNLLYTDYEKFRKITSADLISAAGIDVGRVVFRVVIPLLNAIASTIISLAIVLTIGLKDPESSIVIMLSASFLYVAISFYGLKKLKKTSKEMKDGADKVVIRIQETFNNFKNITLGSHEGPWLDQYKKDDFLFRKSQALASFGGSYPRYFLEPIFLILMVFIGINMKDSFGGEVAIQKLSILVVGIQRLLPQLQKIYEGWAMTTSTEASLISLLTLVRDRDQIIKKPKNIIFETPFLFEKIEVKKVTYKYNKDSGSDNQTILENIDFSINRGETIAIVGKSGSGKSTLIDLISGLIFPIKGKLIVNGVNLFSKQNINHLYKFRKSIAIVPQESFLVEGSILQNITLYSKNIDLKKVKKASQSAGISSYIESLNTGYNSYIGEKGSLLSGGQRQRVSIARCLYENPQLLILDEATSGIDEETEISIIKNIQERRPNLTIILVTHRKAALKLCSKIIKI